MSELYKCLKQFGNTVFCLWLVALPMLPLFSVGVFKESIGVFPTIGLTILLSGIAIYRASEASGGCRIHFSIADIAVGIYALYILFHFVFCRGVAGINDFAVFKVIMLLIVYIYMRMHRSGRAVFMAIITGSTLQALLVILQKNGYILSRHNSFEVTGAFSNPGQAGGYIAIGVVLSVILLYNDIREKNIYSNVGFGIVLFLQLVALYYADSRASLVAVLSGISFAIISKFKISLSRYRHKLIPIFLISAIIGAIALFQYRSGSANARLLIWNVSGNMIIENPVFGHGIGHFEKKYMLYQADYFSQYPESRFAILANNVSSPYNELLRIGVEQGIVGVLFILFLFCSLFYYRPKDISDLISKSGLIALAAFSMFSYPGDTLSLLILFSIFIGLSKSASVFSLDFSKWGIRSIHIVNIAVFITCIPYSCFYTKTSIHTARVMSGQSQLMLNPEELDRLMKSTSFSAFYAYYITHTHEEGNDYQKIISDMIPSCENYCFFGDIFLSNQRYAHAESYYKKAAYMIPCRLTPNYKLWNLYLQKGDTAKAIEIAEYMLEQKLKVENSFTIRSKSEIRKFLAEVNDQKGN